MNYIDINCDLAEGGKSDARLMQLISSCNIACGGHFGNEATVHSAVNLARKNNLKIGAHPSYPDKVNFGRESMDISLSALESSLKRQIKLVINVVHVQNGILHHVKPHGALYNDLQTNVEKSKLLIRLLQELDDQLILYVPPNSAIRELANGKIKTMTEGFADRNYEEDFTLASRKKEHAVLLDKESILKHVLSMVKAGEIRSDTGKILPAKFDTVCLHGDNPKAIEILEYLNEKLPDNDLQIAFV